MTVPNLKLTAIQLGDSATPANNFLICVPDVADGTMVIKRGNDTVVATIDAAGKVVAPGNDIPETGTVGTCSYRKYPDGTLVQAISYTGALTLVGAYGAALYRHNLSFAYAIPFVGSAPVYSSAASDQNTYGWIAMSQVSLAAFTGSYFTTTSAVTGTSIGIVVTGRWK